MSGGWLSRREALGAILGLPAAALVCDPRARRKSLPPGEIVFPAERRGHAVRDGIGGSPASFGAEKVVIVGGGIAGLSAAWRLAGAGFHDFVLLELDDVLGGTAKSGESAVSAFPWGAHYITVPMKENVALLRLLREMSIVTGTSDDGEPVVDEAYLCRDPQERLFYRGTWRPGLYLHEGATPGDAAELARFRARMDAFAMARDGRGRRAFTIPVAQTSDDVMFTELDRLSMAEWLRREGFSSERLLWTVDYACRDDYGATPAQTSAWAGAATVAARARMATAAFDVVPEDGGIRVVALGPSGPVGFRAEQVILATPQLVTKHLLRPYRDERPSHLQEFSYGAWLVANLTVRERPASRGFPFAWDNVLYESPSLGYVVAGHMRGRDHGPTVLTYYHPMTDVDAGRARQRLLTATRDEWAEAVLADLGVAHPELPELTTRLDVMRWGHAMIRPQPGFVWGDARRRAARPFRGVHFAHADLSGLALFEEAFDHGVRAAEEVLTARRIPFESIRGSV